MRALTLALLLLTFGAAPASVGAAQVHRVVIENMKFTPEVLDARVGDTVIWENKDIVPHTATADAAKDGRKTFDSGTIAMNGTFQFTPKAAGELPYTCLFHPTMKARIRITR